MESELKALEDKVTQLVEMCHRLRAENIQLRQQLAASEDEGKRLSEKIEGARTRLEGLLQQIPGDEETDE
jgi:cell division protein ZapB